MHSPTSAEILSQDEGWIHRIVVRLRSRLGYSVDDFRIEPHKDGLILSGRVRTYYGKQLVQVVAMEVSGLPIAANKIEVA